MLTLFMVQLGGRPKGRLIEQHDIFFGVANEVSELIDDINKHWPEVRNKWHIDSYRAISKVDNYAIKLVESSSEVECGSDLKLFFINLGGIRKAVLRSFITSYLSLLLLKRTPLNKPNKVNSTNSSLIKIKTHLSTPPRISMISLR